MSHNYEKSKNLPRDLRQALESLQPHDHLCLIYESHEDWAKAAIPFIAIGIRNREKCIYVVDTHTAEEVRQYLKEEGIDVEQTEKEGQFIILNETQAYTREGSFDPDRMIKLLISETEKALSEGYPALRVTGEMTWVLRGHPGSDKLLEYESKLNSDFFPKYPCVAICQYDRFRFDPEIIKGVIMTHPILISGNRIHRNFYYIPTEDYLNHNRAEIEVKRWLDNLERERKTFEELQRSEKQYRELFENAIEGIYQTTPEGKFISVNPTFARMFGYSPPEEIMEQVTNIGKQLYVNPEDRERFKKDLADKGYVEGVKTEVRRKDGSTFWISINAHVVRDDTGKILYYEGTSMDITERKRAEAQLLVAHAETRVALEKANQSRRALLSVTEDQKRAEEILLNEKEKFLALLDNAPFGMVMISQNGTITYTNQKFEEIFGYEPKEIPDGRTWFRKAYPDTAYRHEVISAWKDDLEGSRVGQQRPKVFTATCKDGSTKIINFISVLLATGDNLMACEDITVRKQAEESLRQTETKYRSIFDNAVEGIFQTSPEGKFLSANPAMARMAGYDSTEELMSSVTDIGKQLYVNPNDRATFITLMKEKGGVEGFEVEHYRKDRSIFWASINAHAVKDETGNILNFEGTFEDITPRKQAEEELATTLESLRRAIGATIQVIVATVEVRDPYTAGHQRRVTDLARAIATELGLSADKIEGIRMAGTIHDIGKISIPAEILSKPTKLTDIEFALVKSHAQYGYEILKNVESSWPLAQIVLQHHERLDGSGYPQGLKDGNILMEANIIAVADVVESMASHRPYRPALGIEAALAEIEKNKGVLYDEKAGEACLRLFREKGFKFE